MTTFTLRLPDELNTWLEQQARLNQRSKQKQIEHILGLARQMPIFNTSELVDLLSNLRKMKADRK